MMRILQADVPNSAVKFGILSFTGRMGQEVNTRPDVHAISLLIFKTSLAHLGC